MQQIKQETTYRLVESTMCQNHWNSWMLLYSRHRIRQRPAEEAVAAARKRLLRFRNHRLLQPTDHAREVHPELADRVRRSIMACGPDRCRQSDSAIAAEAKQLSRFSFGCRGGRCSAVYGGRTPTCGATAMSTKRLIVGPRDSQYPLFIHRVLRC